MENKQIAESYLKKELTLHQLEQLHIYYTLLVESSKVMNLTTIIEMTEVYIKHFLDSYFLFKEIDFSNKTLIDVGSGAGFPGLVLKIIYPKLKVTLLEPTTKKTQFLNKVISVLELKDIVVVNERAENFITTCRESFDFATARAVANLNVLLELLTPFVKVDGKLLILKGSNYLEEFDNLGNSLKILSLTLDNVYKDSLPLNFGERVALVLSKHKKTNLVYPRHYSKIKKQPLK